MNQQICRKFLLWLLLVVSPSYIPQSHAQTELPDTTRSAIQIGALEHLQLRQPARFLTTDVHTSFEQVQNAAFRPLSAAELNQGISASAFWIHVILHNASDEPRNWVLHNDSTYLDNLNIYYRPLEQGEPADFSQLRLSDRQPFSTRTLDYRKLGFAHTTPPGGTTELYLQAGNDKADAVSLNFNLWEAQTFTDHAQRELLFLGAYYGALLALLVITLVIAVALRQRIYLYYAGFLLSTVFMWALLNGVGFQYLWPTSVFLQNEGFHIAYLLFALAAFQFSKAFLQTRRLMPRAHMAINAWQGLMALGILLRIAGSYDLVLNIAFLGLFSLVLLPVLGWHAGRKGVHQARWYMFAWLVYALTLTISAASAYTTILTWGMDPLLFTQLGSLIESCLLLVAIGARILHLDRDRRQALELAHRDPLTGIGNRRLLIEHYENISAGFLPGSLPVYVILIDMDLFKGINDRFGHDAGDRVLQELAQLLQKFSREDDECIRYGGDEFLMVARAKDLDAAYQISERIRKQFADRPTVFNEQIIAHTISVGVIPAITESIALNTSQMLATVDDALYEAKSAGRNQTFMYPENPSSHFM